MWIQNWRCCFFFFFWLKECFAIIAITQRNSSEMSYSYQCDRPFLLCVTFCGDDNLVAYFCSLSLIKLLLAAPQWFADWNWNDVHYCIHMLMNLMRCEVVAKACIFFFHLLLFQLFFLDFLFAAEIDVWLMVRVHQLLLVIGCMAFQLASIIRWLPRFNEIFCAQWARVHNPKHNWMAHIELIAHRF